MQTENLGAEELHTENYSPRIADTSDQVLVSVLYSLTGFFFPSSYIYRISSGIYNGNV